MAERTRPVADMLRVDAVLPSFHGLRGRGLIRAPKGRFVVECRMDLRQALLAAFAASFVCGPKDEEFRFSGEISNRALLEAIADDPSGGATLDNWPTKIECEAICEASYSVMFHATQRWVDGEVESCELQLSERGNSSGGHVVCSGHAKIERYCIGEGRRPFGHVEHVEHVEHVDAGQGHELGPTLAAMAHLEAASVDAFEELATQLQGWAAPRELVQRCRLAAADERRHARWLTRLAEREGASVPKPTQIAQTPTPFEVALHNAREGCVHETFGALLAMHRAHRADRPDLRRIFERIAVDETRHAQLAWDLHDWLCARLSAEQVETVEAARARALA